MSDLSGIGISFGAERIFDVLNEIEGFPAKLAVGVAVMLLSMDSAAHYAAFELAGQLRSAGVKADIYPESGKFKKQMKYVDQRAIPYAIIIGSEEMISGKFTLKDMQTGTQRSLSSEELIRFFIEMT